MMRNVLKKTMAALALSLAAAPAMAAPYTTAATDIGTLLDTPETKAILDKLMPGFSTNEQVAMARGMTLRAVQQFAPDKITVEVLDQVDAELAKLPAK
jgi:hypothetical protein